MILIPEHELIILTPPHTGSRNLHIKLCDRLGFIWCNGVVPDSKSVFDHHTTVIAAEHIHFKRLIIVRNPFARIFGLWNHLVEWCQFNGDGCCGFRTFLDMVSKDDANNLSWLYRYTISRWLGDTHYDEVVQYTELREFCNKNFRIDIGSAPSKYRKELKKYYTEETIELVSNWAKEDIERWPSVLEYETL